MKNHKLLNILYLLLVFCYIGIGIFVLFYSNEQREKNNVILGLLILLSSVPHFFIYVVNGGRKNEKKYPYLAFALLGLTIGIVTICIPTISLAKVCVMWGAFDLCRSSFEICDVIPELKKHEWIELVELVLSLGEIVIAVLLIIDEFEGIRLHLIYFGIVFIVSGVKRIVENFIKDYEIEKSSNNY